MPEVIRLPYSDPGGMADELDEIPAGKRFAAGEMHMQDAQRRRFAEHRFPVSVSSSALAARQLEVAALISWF